MVMTEDIPPGSIASGRAITTMCDRRIASLRAIAASHLAVVTDDGTIGARAGDQIQR